MTKIVGILNITPDSFSDGGKHFKTKDALEHAEILLKNGADIIDVGAESTRPNAELITQEEEWKRLKKILPKLIKLVHKKKKLVSVDTRNSKTALKAIKAGVDIINDVSACSDPDMALVIAKANVPIVISHNLGIPANPKKTLAKNADVILILKNWIKDKSVELIEQGVDSKKIIFDIGIGFGKDAKQSLLILSNLDQFKDVNIPIYVGHSRKSFLDQFEPKTEIDKDSLTAILATKIYEHCDYIRVHNVQITKFMIDNFLTKAA